MQMLPMRTRSITLSRHHTIVLGYNITKLFKTLLRKIEKIGRPQNTIFNHITLQAVQDLTKKDLINLFTRKRGNRTISHLVIFTIVLGHAVAMGIQVILSVKAHGYVHAHTGAVPLYTYDMVFWSRTLFVIARMTEIIGLVTRQAWGWFLTQYTYLSSLPLLWFSSIVVPEGHVVLDTVVYTGIVFLLYLPAIRNVYFARHRALLPFVSVAMIANGLFYICVEVVKTMI